MLKTELVKHPLAYTLLLLGLAVISTVFFLVWPNYVWERLVIFGIGLFYFGWGLGVHAARKSLTGELVKEYAVISMLGVLLLLMLTF